MRRAGWRWKFGPRSRSRGRWKVWPLKCRWSSRGRWWRRRDGYVYVYVYVDVDVDVCELMIDDPQLWWPNNLGAQPLYEVKVVLKDAAGGVLDTTTRRIGLRTLRLDRHPDQWGESLPVRRQRRAVLRQGRQLDPRRHLRHGHDARALPRPAAERRRRQHEHAARVGRRHLRARRLLRPVRRAGHLPVARLHVRLLDLPDVRRRVHGQRAGRGRGQRAPPAPPPVASRCGAATTSWSRAWSGRHGPTGR